MGAYDDPNAGANARSVSRRFGAAMRDALLDNEIGWAWETDAELRFTWFSATLEDVTGIAPDALIGKSRIDVMDGDFLNSPRGKAHVADLLARRPFRDFFYQIRAGEAGSRWLAVSGIPRHDANGVFEGYAGMGRDVTHLISGNSELASLRSELNGTADLLNSTCDHLDAGLVVYDRDDRLLLANPAMLDLYPALASVLKPGAQLDDVLGATFDTGQYATTEMAGRDEWIASRKELYWKPYSESVAQLADGRWIQFRNRRLDNGFFVGLRSDITDLKRQEDALTAASHRSELLEAILEQLKVAVYAKTEDLALCYMNRGWEDFTGIARTDALGKTDADIFGEAGKTFMSEDRIVLESGEGREFAEPHEREDGTTGHGIAYKDVVALSDGTRYVIGSTTDVTALKASELDLQRALDAMHMGVVVVDRDLGVLSINQAFHTIWNTSPDDFEPGCHFRALMDINRHNGIYAIADKDWDDYVATRTGEISAGETEPREFKRADGKTLIYSVRELTGGKRMICYFDITEQKDRETALADAVERSRLAEEILDGLDQGILVKNTDLVNVFVNARFAELHGSGKDEFLGRRAAEIFDPESAARFEESERATLESGETHEIEEDYQLDGRDRSRLINKSRIETASGQRYVAISLTDITEIRNREKALAEAQTKAQLSDRAKSEFLANMSHEIRTPMNGVLGMAELLARTELDPKQKTFTDIIVKSGNALLTIINDILDFSKIDAGQLVLDPAPFDLRESIEDVATLVSARAKEKDLELIARVAPDLPQRFIGDAGRIRQIITNLMGNAVKFTEKGHVLVDLSGEKTDAGWKLLFRVVDTGIGIPADKLAIIFDKFSQVDSSATRRHEGTGLGLAITSKLVELMDGDISVSSTYGEGSEFRFTVTLPADANVASRLRPVPVDVTGARVLIIDDNPVNRDILMEQMASWQFDACAVEGGAIGLAFLQRAAEIGCPVDLVILDYQMPGMTGADVMRALRADAAIAKTPVVMLTSVDQALTPESVKALAVEHHLLKPARSSQLLECIVSGIQSARSANAPVADSGKQAERSAAAKPAESGASTLPAAAPLETVVVAKGAAKPRIDILVAEDNEVNQLVYTQILGPTGYTFQIVGNGRRAVDACKENPPLLILMDVSMPEMNGYEATMALREAGFNDLPIIGVTAHALKGDREKCLEAGMSDYLSKPISPERLEAKIAEWMDEGKVRARNR